MFDDNNTDDAYKQTTNGRTYERVVFEGSKITIRCPHARKIMSKGAIIKSDDDEYYSEEKQYDDSNNNNNNKEEDKQNSFNIMREGDHLNKASSLLFGQQTTNPSSSDRFKAEEGGDNNLARSQVRWFRNHVPLLNLNHSTETTFTNLEPFHSSFSTGDDLRSISNKQMKFSFYPLELSNQTIRRRSELFQRLSSEQQEEKNYTDSSHFLSKLSKSFNTRENVNERERKFNNKTNIKLLHSSHKTTPYYTIMNEEEENRDFVVNESSNKQVEVNGLNNGDYFIDANSNDLVINNMARYFAGKYTCLYNGKISEILIDVIYDDYLQKASDNNLPTNQYSDDENQVKKDVEMNSKKKPRDTVGFKLKDDEQQEAHHLAEATGSSEQFNKSKSKLSSEEDFIISMPLSIDHDDDDDDDNLETHQIHLSTSSSLLVENNSQIDNNSSSIVQLNSIETTTTTTRSSTLLGSLLSTVYSPTSYQQEEEDNGSGSGPFLSNREEEKFMALQLQENSVKGQEGLIKKEGDLTLLGKKTFERGYVPEANMNGQWNEGQVNVVVHGDKEKNKYLTTTQGQQQQQKQLLQFENIDNNFKLLYSEQEEKHKKHRAPKVHLVKAETIHLNDLTKTIPGFFYTKQKLFCPIDRYLRFFTFPLDSFKSNSKLVHLDNNNHDEILYPLIKAMCDQPSSLGDSFYFQTRKSFHKRIDRQRTRLKMKRIKFGCYYLAKRLILQLLLENERLKYNQAESLSIGKVGDILEISWFEDKSELIFDETNGKQIRRANNNSLSNIKKLINGEDFTFSLLNEHNIRDDGQAFYKRETFINENQIRKQENNSFDSFDMMSNENKKWISYQYPLRGRTLEIDGVRKDNSGRHYTCALKLNLSRLKKIINLLRQITKGDRPIKWTESLSLASNDLINDKLLCDEQKQKQAPPTNSPNSSQCWRNGGKLVKRQSNTQLPENEMGNSFQTIDTSSYISNVKGEEIETIDNNKEKITFPLDGHNKLNLFAMGQNEQQQQQQAGKTNKSFSFMNKRIEFLESILTENTTSNITLNYVSQVLAKLHQEPLTIIQTFSLSVAERFGK